MLIIDSHVHLGVDVVFDEILNEKDILDCCDRNGIRGAIVQPFIQRPYMEDTRVIHDRIYRFAQDYPGRIWGMASLNPHLRPEEFEAESSRCMHELGFVGIKLATSAYGCNPSKQDGMHVFEVAQALRVPVMVHTGSGIPFADPAQLIKPAKAFPTVKIVVAHGGGDLTMTQCIQLAQGYDNVYVEPSWIGILGIESMLKALGTSKLMFSSDMPQNAALELAKYRTAIRNEHELERVLSGTCIDVFGLTITSFP
jgi:uncharacterized protein